MKFCIDSTVLGTVKHLLYDDGTYRWTSDVPSNTWHVSGKVKRTAWCLDSLFQLGKIEVDVRPPSRFERSIEPFLSGSGYVDNVPWQMVMPSTEHKAFTKRIICSVVDSMERLPKDYFETVWRPGNKVLDSLQPAMIDVELWQSLIDANVGNVSTISTFRPNSVGYAKPVTYNRFGTLTGRLTVSSGPNILTLKKEYRNIIKPSTPDGKIMILDFAALEVRVLLYEAGKRCEDDIYTMIAGSLGCDRQAAKAAVICELYGSSHWSLGEKLGIKGKELNSFIAKVKTLFRTSDLLERIKTDFIKSGKITNRFGRPVLIDDPLDHVMINYYAQSTGADVALVGFSTIVKKMEKEAPGVRPLYVLHDGLFLDVPKEHIEYVNNIKTVKVKGYVQAFVLKSEYVCTLSV